jgi:lysozyme
MGEHLPAPWDGNVPAAATAVIRRIEAFSAAPYQDNPGNPNNTWTIGYGSTHDGKGHRVTAATPPMSEAEADVLLQHDMLATAREVQIKVTVPLLMCEAAALISWTYNLGGPNLESSTLLRRLNADDKAAIPGEMRRWINQGGKPLLGLLRRRWAEAAIFIGLDPDTGCNRAWANINKLDDWPNFT